MMVRVVEDKGLRAPRKSTPSMVSSFMVSAASLSVVGGCCHKVSTRNQYRDSYSRNPVETLYLHT